MQHHGFPLRSASPFESYVRNVATAPASSHRVRPDFRVLGFRIYAPYRLVLPPRAFLLYFRSCSPRYSCPSPDPATCATKSPLMSLASRPEYDSRRLVRSFGLLRARALVTRSPGRPPVRFLDPTALKEADSDLHRVCLPRLCYAFRFSQPLDVSFRPQPFQPCFMLVTLLGFSPSEVSPHR
jgi:hypothetical protein